MANNKNRRLPDETKAQKQVSEKEKRETWLSYYLKRFNYFKMAFQQSSFCYYLKGFNYFITTFHQSKLGKKLILVFRILKFYSTGVEIYKNSKYLIHFLSIILDFIKHLI